MSDCCGCCVAFKPRYKRLVDSIFPADPKDGLVKSNMDKLTFFAMKSPDKLDRIGEYLAQRLSRDVYRQKYYSVNIAMEALDTLLVTCHAQSLNLFVESFLKMVQKLLECNEVDLQCLATASFVKFANIEEDTPSYHRRYDFFVSKFSSMCHSNDSNDGNSMRLRIAGLHGLQGVVRKTVTDDLQCNIWKPTHMDKIVPSLLFNMQSAGNIATEPESPRDEDNAASVAEMVFRDFICRASYGNINAVIRPVLTHLDNHNLWIPNDFACKCFKIIMYSVQAQYGYIVVQMLMNHLDENSKEYAKIKASIVDVLSETVLIAAGGSIGPSVLEVFNTLLRHLRISVDAVLVEGQRANDERHFQEAIINTIGEFANNLPDYQKIEIMMFVMGKVPLPADETKSGPEVLLQTMLLKSLLKVATKYKTVSMTNAFPSSFVEPLLRMSLIKDAGIRRIVQEILHTLIDRHENLEKLKSVRIHKDIDQLDLTFQKPQRQDMVFIKKNGNLFFWHLFENIRQPNNKVDNYESVYTTMSLIYIEMGGEEIIVELFRLALEIQGMVIQSRLPITHKCAIHAVVAAYLNLISQLSTLTTLCQYTTQVIDTRKKECPYYLPEIAFNRSNTSGSYPATDAMKETWLFNTEMISDALSKSGYDVSRLSTPFTARPMTLVSSELNHSISDIQSINIDVESAVSTPVLNRKATSEEVTFESMKKILDNDQKSKDQEKKRQQQIYESFKNGPFEEIVARSEAKSQKFNQKLSEVLDRIGGPGNEQEIHRRASQRSHDNNNDDDEDDDDDDDDEDENGADVGIMISRSVPVHEIQYPRLFVY